MPEDLAGASAAASSAAAGARGADGSEALARIATALSGSTTAEVVPGLADAWREGVDAWCVDVESFAAAIDAVAVQTREADQRQFDLLELLRLRTAGR